MLLHTGVAKAPLSNQDDSQHPRILYQIEI